LANRRRLHKEPPFFLEDDARSAPRNVIARSAATKRSPDDTPLPTEKDCRGGLRPPRNDKAAKRTSKRHREERSDEAIS